MITFFITFQSNEYNYLGCGVDMATILINFNYQIRPSFGGHMAYSQCSDLIQLYHNLFNKSLQTVRLYYSINLTMEYNL